MGPAMPTLTETEPSTPGLALSLAPNSPALSQESAVHSEHASDLVAINSAALKVDRLKAELDLATMELEIDTLTKSVQEKFEIVAILELEGETDEVVLALQRKVAELTTLYDDMEVRLKQVEGTKQNWALAVQVDKGDLDKVNLRKAELEILKLNCDIVNNEIAIMEAKIALKDHQSSNAPAIKKIADARKEAEDAAKELNTMTDDHEIAYKNFKAKFGTGSARDDSAAVKALEEKMEELLPLYWVGHAIRARYIDGELKMLNGQPVARDVDAASQEAWKFAKVKADAALFLKSALPIVRGKEGFELLYGVSPEVIWKHRKFGMFLNILK